MSVGMSAGKDARGEDVRGEEREPEGRGARGTAPSAPAAGGEPGGPEGDGREPGKSEPEESEPEERESGVRAAGEREPEEDAPEERTVEERGSEERAPGEEAPEEGASEERTAGADASEGTAEAEGTSEVEGTSEAGGAAGADGPDSSGGDGPRVPGEPASPPGQQTKQSHAGNGTVNDGSDRNAGPDAQEAGGKTGQGAGPGAGLLGPDELELRSLLHSSVRVVEPSEGSLEYLRRAVPARRARKRQVLVGAAAAFLFVGTAVPALVHVSGVVGPDADPSTVGHASQAQGGTGDGKGPGGGETTAGGASDEAGKDREDGGKDEEKEAGTGVSTGVTEGADPSASAATGSSACTAAQLGPAVASSGAPDSTGAVYGSFRVTNVSVAGCTVGSPGSLGVTPLGAADAARVGSARHVAGDAAAGLPDPSLEAGQLLLKPGESYDVKFAWVPSEPCPVDGGGGDNGGTGTPGGTGGTGGSGDPSPGPSPSEQPTVDDSTSTGGETGTTPQLLRADGTADGGVTLTYTPASGVGTATATVANACAGTVYWTGLLPATAG
ncbi:hypothetical protein [Streptomyces prasinopilosus]|uniref:Uncharacterized protein n=1 Tax=Streptomyces prasinopilosus TaxID=67344 RepID=A0A1G6VPX4_9ACTN|nr:hypothetical protein [Streptomyces prasinopilosus]SDD55591.1 hypothetical protein SAMN05216505_10957 [Streptomyces prasinopilosus]